MMNTKQTEALKLARDVMKHTRNCLYQSLAQDDVVCDCGVTMARAAIREALAEQPAQQKEPIYQMQMMDGKWIDQAKHSYEYNKKHGNTVRIVYAALQPAQQEPHGWYIDGYGAVLGASEPKSVRPGEWLPLYTSPQPNKPWIGLTNQELIDLTAIYSGAPLYCAIEAKLREKNT